MTNDMFSEFKFTFIVLLLLALLGAVFTGYGVLRGVMWVIAHVRFI